MASTSASTPANAPAPVAKADPVSDGPTWNVAEGDETAARMAQRYIWWKPPEESFKHLHLLFAQMMTLGTMEDLRWLMSVTTDDDLRKVLRIAPAGIFNGRAWHFWHYRLGMTPVPELPKRPIPKGPLPKSATG